MVSESRVGGYEVGHPFSAQNRLNNKYQMLAMQARLRVDDLTSGRKRPSLLDRIKGGGNDINRAVEEMRLLEEQLKAVETDLPNLRYSSKVIEGNKVSRIIGTVSGPGHVDMTLIAVNGVVSVSGIIGTFDAMRHRNYAISIFNFYEPLLKEREDIARKNLPR